MQVTSGSNFFSMLDDIEYDKDSFAGKLCPFKVRVGVVKMSAPRHERFEFLRDMGLGDIDRVFNHTPFNKDVLSFVFPERWMSVHEQQAFMSVLNKHPQVNELKQVDILTSSALMIGNFTREQIRILTWSDDTQYNGEVNQ